MTTKSGEGIELPALDEQAQVRIKIEGETWEITAHSRERQLLSALASNAELRGEVERANRGRTHTQEWYASHYGRLQDWARKVLPDPYRNQFFSCIANGTYDAYLDVGEPYMCKAGFMVTPSGYIHMDDAKGQLVIDQTRRAEDAEAELASIRSSVVSRETVESAWERGYEEGFYRGREYGMNANADVTFMIPEYIPPKPIEREG